jgi:GNAT superfamily N-acetyltransferase
LCVNAYVDQRSQDDEYVVEGVSCERRARHHRPMDEARIVVTDVDDGLADRLDDEIYRFNGDATGMKDGRLIRIAVHSAEGQLEAGLSGWTWGGCGYVDVLWVRGDRRGAGLGSVLLDSAEREARRRGCTQMALSSHTFQAPGFYLARGYSECGRTPDYPRGHAQVHFVKQFEDR